MKKLYFLLIILSQLVTAQVGINTTAPNAQLDIRSSNQASPLPTDGVMVPKVDTLIFPTAAQNGMMVFLTTSTTFLGRAKIPGFYYWENTAADWLGLASNTAWDTAGNTGTTPANNFIGTKDNADLVFKINNNTAGRLNQFNTSYGYNSLLNPLNLDNTAFGTSALSNIRLGSDNIAIGSFAMFFNQDGRRDIAIGNNTLRSTTTSNDNLAIGHLAMNATTTGEFNIAIGNSALQFGGSGNNNVALGYRSQNNNTFGSDNVSVGKISLENNVFGSGNTAIGNYTLGGSFVENSTALGYNALTVSNGQDNTAVGYQAVDANSSGRFNTGVGSNALGGNISGDSNTSIGHNSLIGNGSGNKNTAIGANATTFMDNLTNATAIGANAIVADNNSMVLGSVAGFNNSFNNTKVGIGTIVPAERLHVVGKIRMEDGNQGNGKVLVSDNDGVASWQNTNGFAWGTAGNFFTNPNVNFIGTTDLSDLVFKRNNIRSGLLSDENTIFGFNSFFSGQRNSVFGSHPFAGSLGGSNNSVFGYQALNACTSCGDNAVFGTNAMLFNTFGGANTAVGTDALRVNTSGNFNTAVGYNAAPNIGNGNGNVAIGSNALKNISFTNNNTGLGSETNFGGGVITNSTAIGAHAQVDFSNSIVLGSVNGVNGATSSVNVGMGTTNPSERLHVVGSIRIEDGTQGAGKVMTSDATGRASWTTLSSGGTLDDAYDFGGAGNGRTITADTGAVTIAGSDGLVSTGIIGSGAFAPMGAGVRMLWNPRKAAFRAGQAGSLSWNESNIGQASAAFGFSTMASGMYSTAFGHNNSAFSYGETVLGIGATTYSTTANGATQFGAANQTDRLFVIGNAIDSNNSAFVDAAERRDAMVVLKNGATGIGTSLPDGLLDVNATTNGILIPRVALTSVLVQAPIVNPRGGALPASTLIYNTATAGVSPNNVFPGFYYWNGARWNRFDANGENNPAYYTAVGTANAFTTTAFTSLPQMSITFTPKDDIAFVNFSAAGHRNDDSCQNNVIFFQILLNGVPVTNWQTSSNQSIVDIPFNTNDITTWEANISYPIAVTIGSPQTIQVQWYAPNCTMFNNVATSLTAFGAVFRSYRSLTVIDPNGGGGIVGTVPTSTTLWAHNGNAGTNSSLNFVGTTDPQSLVLKSNNVEGLRISTIGNVGVGTTLPLDKLHVAGSIRMVDGSQGVGKVLTSDVNGTGTWQTPVVSAWGLTGNAGTNDPAIPTTYGTSAITTGENWSGTTDANDYVIGTNSLERFRVKQTTGNVGIGTSTPARKLHIFNGTSGGTSNGNAGLVLESNGAIYQHFLAPATNETGLLFGSGTTSIRGAVLYDNAGDALQFRAGGNTNRMIVTAAGDVGIGVAAPGGQLQLSLDEGRKPATAVWTIASDERLKTVEGDFKMGLNEIRKLNPIRYHYKNAGERKFEQKVLDTEFSGFLAQEVQKIFPNCVTTDPDGYLSLNIHDILIASVNALQELDAKNKELQSENEKLKAKIKQHDEQIAAILVELKKRK